MRNIWMSLLAMLCLAASCKPDPVEPDPTGIFELSITPRVGGQEFSSDQIFENIQGQRFNVEVFKLYLSELRLVKEDGTELPLTDVLLFDFVDGGVNKTEHGGGVFKQFTVPAGRYTGLKFGVGVPDSLNQGNPALYESGHPLSVGSGMHWNWTTGYIFLKLDGRIDTTGTPTGPLDEGFTYHTGTNDLFRDMTYQADDHAFTLTKDTEVQFSFELDLNRFFYTASDTIDMTRDNFTHTTPVGSEAFRLAEEVTDNMTQGSFYKVPF
ncbi:MAG: MbnP family protein [Bacteroidota bacterium]